MAQAAFIVAAAELRWARSALPRLNEVAIGMTMSAGLEQLRGKVAATVVVTRALQLNPWTAQACRQFSDDVGAPSNSGQGPRQPAKTGCRLDRKDLPRPGRL